MINAQSIAYQLLATISSALGEKYSDIKEQAETWADQHKGSLQELAIARINGVDNNFFLSGVKNEAHILESEVLAFYIEGKAYTQAVAAAVEAKFIDIVNNFSVADEPIAVPLEVPVVADTTVVDAGVDDTTADESKDASTDTKSALNETTDTVAKTKGAKAKK